MEAYLDNSATTRCLKETVEIMVKAMEVDYGNPSSMHMYGIKAEKYIKEAKEIFVRLLKCQEKEIIFTSGGTESNNMAIIGAVMANKRGGNHIIVSSVEHSSVKQPIRFLEEQGFRISYLPVDKNGLISLEDLKDELCEETIFVSTMYVNNEIGTVEPIEAMAQIIHNYNANIVFHVDAIQAFGKYKIYPKRSGIDLLSISGHKFHGPKGSGILYIRDKVKIKPLILGGGQQKGMRSGTENVPAIAGLGVAAKLVYENLDEKIDNLYIIKEKLVEAIKIIPGATINGKTDRDFAPHILSVSFEGIRSEVLLHALEDKGVYVSSGSACASNKPGLSSTLVAIGVDKALLDSTIRFSFCLDTTSEEIDYCILILNELLPMLRKFKRS